MFLSRPAVTLLLSALVLAGCGGTTTVVTERASGGNSSRSVQVNSKFAKAPAVAITYAEAMVPVGSVVAVSSTTGSTGTRVTLALNGMPPNRAYGAHVNTKPCGKDPKDAGPRYQNKVDTVQPSVDPAFANAQNEIWLDLTTDVTGAGTSTSVVPWEFTRDHRGASVVVHAQPTATEPGKAGTAGDRIACVTVEF